MQRLFRWWWDDPEVNSTDDERDKTTDKHAGESSSESSGESTVHLIPTIHFVEHLVQEYFDGRGGPLSTDVAISLISFQSDQEKEYVESGFKTERPIAFVQNFLRLRVLNKDMFRMDTNLIVRLVSFQQEQRQRLKRSQEWVQWYQEQNEQQRQEQQEEQKESSQEHESKKDKSFVSLTPEAPIKTSHVDLSFEGPAGLNAKAETNVPLSNDFSFGKSGQDKDGPTYLSIGEKDLSGQDKDGLTYLSIGEKDRPKDLSVARKDRRQDLSQAKKHDKSEDEMKEKHQHHTLVEEDVPLQKHTAVIFGSDFFATDASGDSSSVEILRPLGEDQKPPFTLSDLTANATVFPDVQSLDAVNNSIAKDSLSSLSRASIAKSSASFEQQQQHENIGSPSATAITVPNRPIFEF